MLYRCCYVFLIFIFYAFLGYLVEVVCCSLIEKRLVVNRGFCLGPYLPIYGISCIVMSSFLIRYKEDPIALFVMSALVCTLIEYMTSYILEKIFKARWWDYSEKRFHIEGRVCLENALLFGIGGLVCIYLMNPFFLSLLKRLNQTTLIVISCILMVIFLTDVIITIVTMCQLKIATKCFRNKDATGEIGQMIRSEVIRNATLIRHMLNAFPKIDINKHKDPLARLKAILQAKYNQRRSKRTRKSK